MKKFLTLLLVMNAYLSNAQNNPIFGGGTSDGWDKRAFAQAANNIYTGGTGDGWNFQAFAQTANAIYKGGDGDGWNYNAFAQAANNIYVGGNGDGWSFATFLQPGNAIFRGGDGDGWSYALYLQAGNNIFTGGGGDGWANVYRALGPLPVSWLSFNASKQGETALLKWETAKEENTAYFDVQRSDGAGAFETLGRVAAAGFSSGTRSYSFTDAHPLSGFNYYRIKQVDAAGKVDYSAVRSLQFAPLLLQKIRAYPVPVSTLLTVELPDELRSQTVSIQVVNAAGVLVQRIDAAAGRAANTKAVDVAALPAGTYTLQVVSKDYNGSIVFVKQ